MLGRHNHEDSTLRGGQAAGTQPSPAARLQRPHQATGRPTPLELEHASARLRAELADAGPVETLAAPAAASADRRPLAGGAGPDDRCECVRCTARRVAELACRVQAQLDALTPAHPPAPAPADTDPDARQLLEAPAEG